jgi:CheY-like chemotaxis protein
MGKLPEAARRDVEIIQQTAERAAALTHQLLAFSRKQVLQPKPLDVNALVGGLAPMLARLIGEHIQLVISPGSRPGSVLADPGQLEQVVVNLVVNARDAMPGGGTLEIETGSRDLPSEVQHGLGRIPPGRYVTLAVQDTGSGMSAATLSRIFEPFFTTKDPGKGTGLGLSTVYGIVHQSGGHIGVDSREGAGTTFTIYLSRTEDAPEQATAGDRAALASGRGAVLVAEDDDAVRQLASQVLAACGYTVLESGDPREALAIAERYAEPIDLLLTDIVMPGMRGPSLAAQVLARHRETRVLYMSGYTDEMIASHGALSPPGTFLQKPFTPDVLATAVRGSLDARPLAPR